MRLREEIGHGLRAVSPVRLIEFALAALVMALLTLFIGDLPELEVIESTVNDDSFSDLVITTRGELPIDTSIILVTYGPSILDEQDRVDRALLAQGLAYLLNFDPAIVGVDFMIDGLRQENPEGDQMLAGIIAENRDRLIFGAYAIDSLGRSMPLPEMFATTRLASVNLMPGEDRVIRTFRTEWPGPEGEAIPLMSVAVAAEIDPEAIAYLEDLGDEEFVIDYAAGIGEHTAETGTGAAHVFPSVPMTLLEEALFSESTEDDLAVRHLIEGKAVLVGYADLRSGQLTSIVDRFWTPLKPEENALPDMHGVAIHANILNTILQRRAVTEVPVVINLLWGTLIVFLMFLGRAALTPVRPTSMRTTLRYLGWGLLLAAALFVPIFLFRSTPYKLSVYTPFAGLILGRLVLTVYDRLKRLAIDTAHRRQIRKSGVPLAGSLLSIIRTRDPRERYVDLLHQVQRTFHLASDHLFVEARRGGLSFRNETIGSPTPGRVLADVAGVDLSTLSPRARSAELFVRRLQESASLRRALRIARSLVIAVNEIDRQTLLLQEDNSGDDLSTDRGRLEESQNSVAGALSHETGGDRFDESDRLIEDFLRALEGTAPLFAPESEKESLHPFILSSSCRLHTRTERFVYLSEQEDANNRDDYHDLIYAGETIRCRPESHPGLSEFRRRSGRQREAKTG